MTLKISKIQNWKINNNLPRCNLLGVKYAPSISNGQGDNRHR